MKKFLRRSLSARILIIFIAVTLLSMTIQGIYSSRKASQLSEQYCQNISLLCASMTAQYFGGIDFSELTEEGLSIYADALKDLENDEGIQFINIFRTEYPYESGCDILTVSGEDVAITNGNDKSNWKALIDAEKQCIELDDRYFAPVEGKFQGFAAFWPIHDAEGNISAIAEVFISSGQLDAISTQSFAGLLGLSLLAQILLLIFYILILRKMILNPIHETSTHMHDFVQGNKLSAEKLIVKGEDQLSDMRSSFNSMSDSIRNYVDNIEKLNREKEKTETENRTAYEIQMGMQPPAVYEEGIFSFRALMKPALYVGGDFYDYFRIDDSRYGCFIGDVSGKGMSAALMSSSAMTAIRFSLRLLGSPAAALQTANDELCERNPESLFVTAFAAVYDEKTGTLTYANAGHNPPVLLSSPDSDGQRAVRKLDGAKGLLLGLFENEDYTETSLSLESGSEIFLYTDGVTEAVGDGQVFFGEKRLEETLAAGTGDSIESVRKTLSDFVGAQEQHDDITMLSIRLSDSWDMTLPAGLPALKRLKEYFLQNTLIPEQLRKKIYLAVEEIFVNVVNYAYPDQEGSVRLSLSIRAGVMTLTVRDHGIPFDPLENVADPETYDPELEIGGLGRLMVFTIMDESSYEYRDGENILTLKKNITVKA